MSYKSNKGYFHATPGRFRVQVTGIKRNEEAAGSLEILLASQLGIRSVRASASTGNVLVNYDANAMSHDDVLCSMADLGHMPVLPEEGFVEEKDSRLCALGLCLGKSIAKAALKQMLVGGPAAIILELI